MGVELTVDGVEVRSLAERVLSCGGSIANVVPVLVSTDETDVRVDTVRLRYCQRG